jgi:hypothetical protein
MRLDDAPDVITRALVMEIFQYRSLNALYRAVQAGKFPSPDLTQPARWSRDRLRLWWTEGRRVGTRQTHRIAG